jgi:hypothetical protein
MTTIVVVHGTSAALTNAIEDALAPLGVKITEQWLPPSRILQLTGAIQGRGQSRGAFELG